MSDEQSLQRQSHCHAENDLLREQFWMLTQLIPKAYLINCVCVTILALAFVGTAPAIVIFPLWLVLLTIAAKRTSYWWSAGRRKSVPLEEMRQTVAPMPKLVGVLLLLVSIWTIMLAHYGDETQQAAAIGYLCLATFLLVSAVACIPVGANIVVATGAVPMVCWLLYKSTVTHLAFAGIYAANLAGAMMFARYQYQTFVDAIALRNTAERNQERAEAARRQLVTVANTDPLTELHNRRAFLNTINRRIKDRDENFVLGLIDLDGFKPVNDIYGHAAGDEVLRAVAKRLRAAIGAHGLAARLGGDEFGFLLEDNLGAAVLRNIAQSAVDAIGRPIALSDGLLVNISACCGLAHRDDGSHEATILLERADQALYQAKRSGRGTISIYDEKLKARISRRGLIEKRLSKAIQNETFSIAYQPIRSLVSDQISSYEALARWNDDELGPVSPAEFIPIAEQTGLITPLSQKLFNMALRDASNWPANTRLSFNVSPVQFLSPGFALHTLLNLSNKGFPPERLVLEITETALMSNMERARSAINHLNASGIRLALDDFGTGYASFGYLDKLSFDKLKIDRTLVTGAETDAKKRAIVKAIVEMCHNLEINCVAEGIETEKQLNMMRSLGCRFGQGYLLGKPAADVQENTPVHATSR